MSADRPETLFTRLSTVFRYILGGIVALGILMVATILPNLLGLPPAFRFVSFLIALVVLTAAYGLRSHPVFTFGVRTTVGYAVAREGRCDECDTKISAGERRRYARQAVAFGVPVYTLNWGVNTYCYDCRKDNNHDDERHADAYEREVV